MHQPALDLPAPEVVEGDDGNAPKGEDDEDEVMPIVDLPEVDHPSEVPEQPEEQAKVVNKARKIGDPLQGSIPIRPWTPRGKRQRGGYLSHSG